jgi:hypothetical protein
LTEVFQNLGTTAARARGYRELRTLVLPHPVEGRPEAAIRELAQARLGDLLALLGRAGA